MRKQERKTKPEKPAILALRDRGFDNKQIAEFVSGLLAEAAFEDKQAGFHPNGGK